MICKKADFKVKLKLYFGEGEVMLCCNKLR